MKVTKRWGGGWKAPVEARETGPLFDLIDQSRVTGCGPR
jgi:hypothetical protein